MLYRKPKREINPLKLQTIGTLRSEPKKPKRLKVRGKRGQRLEAGDREITERFRKKDCLCGCGAVPDPAHLTTRRHESTRHEERLIIPLCRLAHRWLDQTADGVRCRAVLLEMAQAKGKPLTAAEFQPIASQHGLYVWLARQK